VKRKSIEDYQRERREQEARAPHTTPGDEERKERVREHGRDCLRRVKGDATWEDWLGIGAAMMDITEEALAEVGVAVWDGNNKRLTKAFTQRWEEYEASAAEPGSNQKPLSKQERWALREVMTNPDIGAWRTTLDGVNRRKLNHPNRVIDRWKSATQTRDREPKKPSDTMSKALKERGKVIEQQEARIKELEEEAGGRPAPAQTLDEIVAALVNLWHGLTNEELLAASKQFNTLLREGLWPAKEVPKKKKGKGKRGKAKSNDVLKQTEDALNAALNPSD
jgi:hypothetical protein